MVEGEVKKEEIAVAEPDMITLANQAAERLEKANQEAKALLEKNQAIETRIILGGKATAGQPPEKKEETPKEYVARIMRGGV